MASAIAPYVPPREDAGSPDSLLGEHHVEALPREGEPAPTAFAGIRLVLTAPGQVGGTLLSASAGAAASGKPLLGSHGLSGDGKGLLPRRPATELAHQRPGGSFSQHIKKRSQAGAGLVGTRPSPRGGATPSPGGSWSDASPAAAPSFHGREQPAPSPAGGALSRANSGTLAGPAPSRGPSFTGSHPKAPAPASSASRLASARREPSPQPPPQHQQQQRDRSPSPAPRLSGPPVLAILAKYSSPQLPPPPADAAATTAPRATGDGGRPQRTGARPERYAFRAFDAASSPGMPARPFGAHAPRKLAQRRAPLPEAGPSEPPPRALDGFLLLEMAGVALPELATVASVTGRGLLSVVSADMEYFPALAALDLSDNALPLAAGLAPLLELRELQLSCNRLRSLCAPPGAFAALRVLDCSFNALPPEELVALSSLPSLAWLDCASNAVYAVPPEVSSGFRSLEVLSLGAQRPPLRDAALEPLSRLPRLRVLHAPHNALAAVPALPLDAFPSLQLLDLRSNRIRAAAALAPLGGCPLLREVLLHGNPLAQRRDLPRGGGVLALGEGGQVTLAPPERARRRRRDLDPFGLEAPLPTVAQALASGDRLETLAARLEEAIAASRGALLPQGAPPPGARRGSAGGDDYCSGDEEFAGSAFLPRDGFAEGLEAAFAEAVGFGGGDDTAPPAAAATAAATTDWARGDRGPSVFLTEVDEGGPAPEPGGGFDDDAPPPPQEGRLPSLLPASHEEMVAQFGPRRRIGGVQGGGHPSQAFQALKHALDHPLTTRTGVREPHFLTTTAATAARGRAVGPAPVHKAKRGRAPKTVITDNTQHLLDSMKNRLTAVNNRLAHIVPDGIEAKKSDSDSDSDAE